MADPKLLQRPADLGELGLGDFPAGLRGVEIMAASVSVELDEQPVPLDHLGQATEGRGRALLLDQNRRVELAGRIIEGDHQVQRAQPLQPGVGRAVLMQHHPDHRPSRPPAPVRTPPGCRCYRPALLQPQPGGGVAQLVAVPAPQRVVEMPDREPGIVLVVELEHPLQLRLRRPPRRRLAHPPVGQPGRPLLRMPPAPAAEGPLADAKRRCRLRVAQPPRLPPLQQLLKAHHPDPQAHPRPTLPSQHAGTVLEPDRPRAPYAGQLARSLHGEALELPRPGAATTLGQRLLDEVAMERPSSPRDMRMPAVGPTLHQPAWAPAASRSSSMAFVPGKSRVVAVVGSRRMGR